MVISSEQLEPALGKMVPLTWINVMAVGLQQLDRSIHSLPLWLGHGVRREREKKGKQDVGADCNGCCPNLQQVKFMWEPHAEGGRREALGSTAS